MNFCFVSAGASCLATNQYIKISNENTNSGFILTWINTTSSPQTLNFNTLSGKLYANESLGFLEYTKNVDYTIQYDTTERDYLFAFSNRLREENESRIMQPTYEEFFVEHSGTSSIGINIKTQKT